MDIKELVGKTLISVVANTDLNVLTFLCTDNTKYEMYHRQDCCEDVCIDDICGDLLDLIESPIILAEENSNNTNRNHILAQSFTWTFYNIATVKGHVTIRWYGESNGYYSEEVDFREVVE